MRRTTLALACALVASTAAAAHADSGAVWAKRDTKLHARPGEASTAVGRVLTGERLVVLGSRGRWLRVRHRQRTGWVTRTQVEERDERATARKRAGRSGFSGKQREDALRVTVDIDRVRAFDDPRTKAREVLDLKRGDNLVVLGRGHEGWILVEAEGEGVGWIPASSVTDGGRFVADPRRAPSAAATAAAAMPAKTADDAKADAKDGAKDDDSKDDDSKDDDDADEPTKADSKKVAMADKLSKVPLVEDEGEDEDDAMVEKPSRRFALAASAAGGVDNFGSRQSGAAGEALVKTTGPTMMVDVGARYRITDTIWIGAGADVQMSSGNYAYSTLQDQVADVPVRRMAMGGHAEVAYAPGWLVALRAGWHFGTLEIGSDRPDSILIGEQVAGPTVGIAGAVPLFDRFSAMASFDMSPAMTQRPTETPPGLLFGKSMQAAWGRLGAGVRLPWHLSGLALYQLSLGNVDLTDGAATPTTASRTDISHTVTAGVGLSW